SGPGSPFTDRLSVGGSMSLFLQGGFWSVGGGASRVPLRAATPALVRVAAVLLSIVTCAAFAQSLARAETTASFADRWWPESDEPIKPIRVAVIHFSGNYDSTMAVQREPAAGSVKQALQRSGEGLASFYGSEQQTANRHPF